MAITKKKQKFFDIEIPIIERETQAMGFEISELDGRFIKYDLTKMLRGKSIELQLKIKVKDGKAIATPRGIELMGYYIRRSIRNGTNYVEDSFSANCKNAQLRIKPFMITRRKVSRAVRKALRDKAREEIANQLKGKDSEKVFDEVLKGMFQKQLSSKLKKVYPLSLCEIRILKIEKDI